MTLVDIFKKAEQSKKDPRINFMTDDGQIINIYPAKNPRNKENYLYAKLGKKGQDYNKMQYIGLIQHSGMMRLADDCPPKIKSLMRLILNDPAGIGAIHGKTYSNCCFCGTEITTKESLAVGYGPICAEKWGLPWGDGPVREAAKEEYAQQKRQEQQHVHKDVYEIANCPQCSVVNQAKEEQQGSLEPMEVLNAFVDWLYESGAMTQLTPDKGRDLVCQFLNQKDDQEPYMEL